MWYLTSSNDNRIIYIVSSDEIVIGRTADVQVCNFAITDDPSISRKHASLVISENNLVLQDLGSRYGTFLNDATEKIGSNTPLKLSNNDIVKFGKMNSIWTVHGVNHVTCTSTLKGENLQNLKLILSKIGGVFKSDWDDSCTYLTMPAITLTIKVVLALVQGSYIVTTDYWNKCIEAVNGLEPLPDPTKFTPAVVESTLNKEVVSFLPDVRRKSLFVGKKIIFFLRRQFDMYKTVLTQSSASPMLLSESRMSASMLCEEGVIVIQYVQSVANPETQAQRNQINDIVHRLKSKGKRVIADAEIGLAILYCSTEKYCNPNFSFTTEVVKQKSDQGNKIANVLAPETQETTHKVVGTKGNVIINESLVADDNKKNILDDIEKLSAKRKLSEISSEYNENPNKKVATACLMANVPNENSKRKFTGEDDTASSNPHKKQALNEKEDDDIFKFVNSNGTDNQNKTKRLNLARPQKRKLDGDRNDGLFNFVQTDEEVIPSAEAGNESMFTIDKIKQDDSTITHVKVETVTAEDVAAMRGVKLKELMESNITYNDTLDIMIKKEKGNELEEKMRELDLGCTIVITCNDLIVKKEPLIIEDHNNSVRNFKTFKKVWPLKKQNTVIPASSMVIVA